MTLLWDCTSINQFETLKFFRFVIDNGSEEVLEELFLLIFENGLEEYKILTIDAIKRQLNKLYDPSKVDKENNFNIPSTATIYRMILVKRIPKVEMIHFEKLLHQKSKVCFVTLVERKFRFYIAKKYHQAKKKRYLLYPIKRTHFSKYIDMIINLKNWGESTEKYPYL